MNSSIFSSLVYCIFYLSSCNAYNTAPPPAPHNYQQISTIDLIHHSYKDLFPEIDECCPVKLIHPISRASPTGHDAFPQIVFLHYIDANGNSSFPCSGTLISKSHVLTAAHCVTGPILTQLGELSYVRFGVNNLSQSTCGGKDCSRSVIDSRIANVVFHKHFHDVNGQNDIALIRLEEPITKLISSIHPICLRWVHKPAAGKVSAGDRFTVVEMEPTTNAKQRLDSGELDLTFFNHDECEEKYARRNITITNSQLCAGGAFKEGACQGDSGGPLISYVDNCFVLDGVFSFAKDCGLEQWPGVYTDVTSYKRWIVGHMRQ